MSKKTKAIVKADGFALTEALRSASSFVKSTKDTLKAETKVLSYGDKIRRLQSGLGRQLDSILTAFEKYNNAVTKRMAATGLKVEEIVTPQIRSSLIEPYENYVNEKLGAQTIEGAIEKINNERAKDLRNFGRNDRNIEEINKFYDLKISKYVLPLQYIETQLNSLVYTKGDRKTIANTSKPVLKIEVKEIVAESNAVVEEQKAKARLMAQLKRDGVTPFKDEEKTEAKKMAERVAKAKATRERNKAAKEAEQSKEKTAKEMFLDKLETV